MKKIARISGVVIAASVGFAVNAASFDCALALGKLEKIICQDKDISELDSRLGKAYQSALERLEPEGKRKLQEEQRHWLRLSRNTCAKPTCLKHAYWSRLAAIENYFEPHSSLYTHESEKAKAIQEILAKEALYPIYETELCVGIFDALKEMKGVKLIDPLVQTQSFEDAAFDVWKKQCIELPPLNFSYFCESGIQPADANDVIQGCNVSYGMPPYKLYELPPVRKGGAKRYFLYSDDVYGPVNRDWSRPLLGGGFAGFRQVEISQCLVALGNRWGRGGQEIYWQGVHADAGKGGRNGKNYNSVIEYRGEYYFLILNQQNKSYELEVLPTKPDPELCRWADTKK